MSVKKKRGNDGDDIVTTTAKISKTELMDCEGYVAVLNEWENVKKQSRADQAIWRTQLTNEIQKCKKIERDCDTRQISELSEILTNINSNATLGGKMVGGGYAELVAQLENLATWLTHYAGHISNCVKWFLQKIWEAAKVAAEAIVRAGSWGATTMSIFATAAADATGITDMLALLESAINLGDAVISDVYAATLGDKTTATYMIAVAALHFVIDPVSAAIAPYGDVMNGYINQVAVANREAIITAKGAVVITPDQLKLWLDNTRWYDKIYTLIVAGKIFQIAPVLASGILTAAGLALNAGLYFTPFAVLAAQSRVCTLALLSHAAFYNLSEANQVKLLSVYEKLDEYVAGKIQVTNAAQLQTFKADIETKLTGNELTHYKNVVGLKQKIAQVSATAGEIQLLIKYDDIERNLALQVAAARENAARLEAELARRRGPGVAAPASLFLPVAAGSGLPSLSSSSSSSSSPSATTTSSEAAEGLLNMDTGHGGNRSTRKRGSNKKGKTKSKRSPKSTRKGGRKQSARKIR